MINKMSVKLTFFNTVLTKVCEAYFCEYIINNFRGGKMYVESETILINHPGNRIML